MNDIISLLDLEDDTINYIDTVIDGLNKTVIIEKFLTDTYCPICGSKAYYKGKRSRLIKHPILQDKTKLYLKVYFRR